MVKSLLITSALSIAIGAIGGYYLQKLESQPITKKDSGEAIAPTPKQIDLRPKSKRSELLLKYDLCTGTKTAPETLQRLNDKELNDLVFSICTQNS